MILTPTNTQIFAGKDTVYVMNEYYTTNIILGGTSEDVILNLPSVPYYGLDYNVKIENMIIQTNSIKFDVAIGETTDDIDNELYMMLVQNNDLLYNETDMDIFVPVLIPGDPKIVTRIINQHMTDITEMYIKVVVEVFHRSVV